MTLLLSVKMQTAPQQIMQTGRVHNHVCIKRSKSGITKRIRTRLKTFDAGLQAAEHLIQAGDNPVGL